MAQFPNDATVIINGTSYQMKNRRPDKGLQSSLQYSTNIFTSQSGHEKRSAKSRRSKRTFSLSYTNITGAYKIALENFFRDRLGETESFEFDLTYIGLSGSILTRLSGNISSSQILATLDPETSFYTVSFNLEETFS